MSFLNRKILIFFLGFFLFVSSLVVKLDKWLWEHDNRDTYEWVEVSMEISSNIQS